MQELIIEPGRTDRQYWKDLWSYRELFYFLAWRDVLVRYKQTIVGIAWAVIRPLLAMAILTVVFSRVAELPSDGVPYPILVFCGMLPWQFFSAAVTESGNSLVSNAALVSKVYFPRMAVPASSIATSLVDFLVSAALLVLLMIGYQFAPSPRVLLLPLFLLLALAAALGFGLWLAALTVRFRDFRHVVPFIAQFGLYISPVGFTSTVIPDQWRLWYSLNPMVGIIDGFRWSVLGASTLYLPGLFVSTLVTLCALVTGIRYFRRTERTFADII